MRVKRVIRLLVKICGVKTTEEALAAEAYGADWIGFIMAPSRRRITPAKARMICRHLTRVQRVGVFVDAPLTLVQEMAEYCGFDRVQLHGRETADYCEALGLPYVKSLLMSRLLPASAEWAAYKNGCFLVDSGSGSGETFDWGQCEKLPDAVRRNMLLAGGLNAGNVAQAIQLVEPLGVDVSSGVETNGVKDLEKIAAFIRNAR